MAAVRPFTDRVVIVTGASSGIGQALARALATDGARLVLAARRRDRLDALVAELTERGALALAAPTDVTDDAQCATLVHGAVTAFGRLDCLVANAGISTNARVQDMDVDVARRVMAVNYFGAVQTFLHALPHLIRARGQAIVVSSLAGKAPTPTRAAYCASKFALHGFFESARLDLRETGIGILVACPGFVESEIREQALLPDGTAQRVDDLASLPMQSAEDCAREILAAARADRRELVMGGLGGRLLPLLHDLAPGLADRVILKTAGR